MSGAVDDRSAIELARHNLAEMHRSAQGLRELLETHQELSRVQGNRIDALEAELGTTQAKLRAAQSEIQRLETMLHGYERKAQG